MFKELSLDLLGQCYKDITTKKICEQCGAEYASKSKKSKYCSSKCASKYRRQHAKPNTRCSNCHKQIYRPPWRIKDRNYCSAKCQCTYEYENNIRDRYKITEAANKHVRKHGQPSLIGKPAWNSGLTKDDHPSLKKLSEDRIGKNNPQYGKYGELNTNWKGRITSCRKKMWGRSEYNQWRLNIYHKDKYTCQKCGDNKGGNLNAHHLNSWDNYKELRYNIFNGITLCNKCHEELHKRFGYGNNTDLETEVFIHPEVYIYDFGIKE